MSGRSSDRWSGPALSFDRVRSLAPLLALSFLLAACTTTQPAGDSAGLSMSTSLTSPSPGVRSSTPSSEAPSTDRSRTSSRSAATTSVLSIHDGDTIKVSLADGATEVVRMLGLNAPERNECYGAESTALLTDLLGGNSVTLVQDGGRDQFGRLLAEVWVGSSDVAAEMVAAGAAIAYHDGRSPAKLLVIQESARAAGRGLWATDACGASAGASLEVTAIAYDAPGDDSQNLDQEWVRITNTGEHTIELNGWQVRDESSVNRYTFGAVTFGAGESLTLVSGCGNDGGLVVYWCASGAAVWNNGGDAVFVMDPAGNTVAYRGYDEGDPSAAPVSQPPTTTIAGDTPTTTSASARAEVKIVALNFDAPGNDNENKNGEWVRLRNEGTSAVDLTGWRLQDEGPNHTYPFPTGYTLAAGAEVTVHTGCGTDGETELYWCVGGSAVWNNTGDTAFVYDAAGALVDSASR